MSQIKQKACLICIDGWGNNSNTKGNAIANAQTPVMTSLSKTYPTTELAAHGLAVGLPDGLMGNSEVGHLNIGAGRVVYQDIVRIELSIKKDKLKDQEGVLKAFEAAKKKGKLHLLGLVSDGGVRVVSSRYRNSLIQVHSHMDHLIYLLKAAKAYEIPQTFIHFFGDGRDTAPKSAHGYLSTLLDVIKRENYGKVATITGRYYAMDRDKRWERIQVAYEGLVQAMGEKTDDPLATIQKRYDAGETDEFLKPIICAEEGKIQDGDALITFNYRSDRMREICQTFLEPPFETSITPKDLTIVTMSQYKSDFPFTCIFPPQTMDNVLAEWLGKHKVSQSHIAETEKYAHVTFFFNGGTEKSYDLEDRVLIASPKVATYDLKPSMSAIEVGEKVAEVVKTDKFGLVMCNFAPPDMVGHTGVYDAAIKGVEATDKAIGIIYEACKEAGYVLFVTADHGNAEKMLNEETGEPHTAHTTNPVPFIMTSKKLQFDTDIKETALCDVAPTLLDVMGLPVPKEMTGQSLIKH